MSIKYKCDKVGSYAQDVPHNEHFEHLYITILMCSLYECVMKQINVFSQLRENNNVQQVVVDLICRGQEHFSSVEVGKCFSIVQGAVLFAILYQEHQDYRAQGAVKSLPTPRSH